MTSIRVADRYSLDQEIGRGGSGAVWLGRDEILGRQVAVKRIGLPPGAATPDMVRAEREARLAARVNHPNVVAVFDFVEEADSHWLVMEYVEGSTLATLIRERGPLSPDDAAEILRQVADALAAAHAMSIVHRDVKPSNILVGTDGQVKLSDFGIARAVADASLTQTGLVTGSPAYLSPEVATGGSATTASDVWSLGATLYHALAGHPPYEGEGDSNAVLGILYRIVHEEPPRLRDAGWLGPLLAVTMTKDPAHRPSMAEVAEYLHARHGEREDEPTLVMAGSADAGTTPLPPPSTVTAALRSPPSPPSPPARRPEPDEDRRGNGTLRAAVIGGAVVAVLAIVGLALLFAGGGDDPDVTAGRSPSQSAEPNGDGQGQPSQPTTSPSEQQAPTEQELQDFASNYVQTASTDPAAGFAMLTSDYQARSPDYEQFWGPMRDPEILEISADPATMTVTYTYKYDYPSRGNVTETITLELVEEDGQLLIANGYTSG